MASDHPLHRRLMWLLAFAVPLISHVGRVAGGGEKIPSTPKAYLFSYWEKHVTNDAPLSEFLLDKASPLTAAQFAEFRKIADDPKALSQRLPEFCAQANLMCFKHHEDSPELEDQKENKTPQFQTYNQKGGSKEGHEKPPADFPPEFKEYNHYHKDSEGYKGINKPAPPPGIFFREAMLKPGTQLRMPDFIDQKPRRSFLPRAIVSKLPFASSKISEIRTIFHAANDSSMSKMISDATQGCERVPNRGETKRCVASIEDMIDFATFILGRNAEVRTMDTPAGSNGVILLGDVKGINGGEVTNSVSCHQTLYPYLLYYCHSVNGVRVYEADILDPKTKSQVNHGVAICHEDTSSWSPDHAAFQALRSSPGKTEVCHWIFQNDLIWVAAD